MGIRTEVIRDGDRWRLLRGGEPLCAHGVGGTRNLPLLARLGGNAVRTWHPESLPEALPAADAHGMTVLAGLDVPKTRHGFDFDDEPACRRVIDEALGVVERFKDHPAILGWGLGNEVTLHALQEEGIDPAPACRFLNRLARAVKRADPDHLVCTVVAAETRREFEALTEECPDLDLLGVNAYGAGASHVPDTLAAAGWDRPYMLTEFGPRGWWESAETEWGAKREPTSTDKAETYRRTFLDAVAGCPGRCVGSYAFLWGDKQERTYSWFGMLLPTGERVESADAMSELWSGRAPEHRCPRIRRLECAADGARVRPGSRHEAVLGLSHPDEARINLRCFVAPEGTVFASGGDPEPVPQPVPGLIEEQGVARGGLGLARVVFRAPAEPGAYRLYIEVHDDRGGAATANVPFMAE